MHIPHDGVVAGGGGQGAWQGKAISVKPMKSKQLKQWNFRTNTQRIDGGNGSGSASEVSMCVLVSYMCVCVCVCVCACVD